jgi:hypothetical protein
MIVEDEGFVVDHNERFDYGGDNVEPPRGRRTRTLEEYIEAHQEIRNKEDLIEHLWNHHPDLYSYNI